MKIFLRSLLALSLIAVLMCAVVACTKETPEDADVPARTTLITYTDESGEEHSTVIVLPEDDTSISTTTAAETTSGKGVDDKILDDDRTDFGVGHPVS